MKSIMRFFAFIILLLLAGASPVRASSPELLLDGNVQRIFTSEDGLLSTSSTAIAQTTEGFIWIGGYGGLVRYDGRSFEEMGKGEITNISALLSGSDGTLYIASADSGICLYKNGEFLQLPGKEQIREVECLSMDANGTVWFGTENGIGYMDGDNEPCMLDIPELKGNFIHRIFCARNGSLQIVTRQGRLYTYDGTSCSEPALETDTQRVRSVFQTKNGDYYIGTSGSRIWHCDENLVLIESIQAKPMECINDISLTDDGILWICADNGIAAYKDGELRVQRMDMNNSVDLMMTDMEGNIWFVSSRQGVLELSASRFGNISRSAGLPSMVVNAIVTTGGRMYVGHDEGLLILDENTYEVIEDPDFSDLASVRIRCLYADEDGSLWVGTRGRGLLHYTKEHIWESFDPKTQPEIRSDSFRCICPHDGGLICGTDAGAYIIRDGKARNVVDDADSFRFRVLGIAVLGDTLYLGTDGYGLYMVRDGKVEGHTTTEDGLHSNVIMKFCESRKEEGLWLVTGNRIAFINKEGEIRNIDRFPSNNNLDFLIPDEEVWIFTGSGIFRTTEESLLNEEADPVFTHYRQADGMPYEIVPNSNQCLSGNMLYFCGSGGISSLNLKAKEKEAEAYHLAAEGVLTDSGEKILPDEESGTCVIGADVQRFDIDAHVLTYQSGNPRVYYYLEGFDRERVETELRNLSAIRYTNLGGGDYVFHFGVLSSDTGEEAQEITLLLHKEYKWYERRLVQAGLIAALGALLVAAGFVVVRIRTRKVGRTLAEKYEKQEKEHLRQIAYRDYLTGLYNRNYLEVWNSEGRGKQDFPVTYITADCNHLKLLNDTYGHKQGDRLLKEMADLLKKHFPEDRYVILRVGGDEFLILGCGVEREEAAERMEEVRAEARQIIIVEGIPVTFGYGLCTQSMEEFDFDEGLRLSDLEMLGDKNKVHRE